MMEESIINFPVATNFSYQCMTQDDHHGSLNLSIATLLIFMWASRD
jgi:hypothetical protein